MVTETKTIKVGGNGLSLGTVLFLIFLVLKLTGAIDWSWWWVTAPLWLGWAVGVVIFALIGLSVFVYGAFEQAGRKRRYKAAVAARKEADQRRQASQPVNRFLDKD